MKISGSLKRLINKIRELEWKHRFSDQEKQMQLKILRAKHPINFDRAQEMICKEDTE